MLLFSVVNLTALFKQKKNKESFIIYNPNNFPCLSHVFIFLAF